MIYTYLYCTQITLWNASCIRGCVTVSLCTRMIAYLQRTCNVLARCAFIHASGTARSTRDFNYFRHHRGWNSLGKWKLRKPIKLHLKGSHWKSVAVIVVRETIILGAALLVCFEELFFASFQWIG